MMTKAQFNDLVLYLKNRPAEAMRLREVLGAAAQEVAEEPDRWVTAKEVGKSIGKSGKWVREHLILFPRHMAVKRGTRFAYMFSLREVTSQYSTFIQSSMLTNQPRACKK